MSHYILKLVSGETVYGKMVASESNTKMLVIKDPLVWEEYETEEGSGSAMVRYMAGTDEKDIPISTRAIISMSTMSKAFTGFYDAAVELQSITDYNYKNRINQMTNRLAQAVMDLQAKEYAAETDDLVAYNSDTTIH